MKVTLLGTGTSTGIPVIGCACEVCTSADSRDRRTRTSCLVQIRGMNLVIDTGPDFRFQALREGISRVDAVLFTHHHFDHIVGLDDLRPFLFENHRSIPCYARSNTVEVLRDMFRYIFLDRSYPGVPNLNLISIDGTVTVVGRYQPDVQVRVEPIEVFHGPMPLFGYRIGGFAYLTDTSHIPEAAYRQLAGLDVLVLDALRRAPHPTHFSLTEAVEAARRVGARHTYLIHMTHSVLHARENLLLPEGISLGFDGLQFETGEHGA